jgi:hypothetical protein
MDAYAYMHRGNAYECIRILILRIVYTYLCSACIDIHACVCVHASRQCTWVYTYPYTSYSIYVFVFHMHRHTCMRMRTCIEAVRMGVYVSLYFPIVHTYSYMWLLMCNACASMCTCGGICIRGDGHPYTPNIRNRICECRCAMYVHPCVRAGASADDGMGIRILQIYVFVYVSPDVQCMCIHAYVRGRTHTRGWASVYFEYTYPYMWAYLYA